MFYIFLAILICLGLSIFLYRQNNRLSVTRLEYSSVELPEAFDGFRIACLADLHNKRFPADRNLYWKSSIGKRLI